MTRWSASSAIVEHCIALPRPCSAFLGGPGLSSDPEWSAVWLSPEGVCIFTCLHVDGVDRAILLHHAPHLVYRLLICEAAGRVGSEDRDRDSNKC